MSDEKRVCKKCGKDISNTHKSRKYCVECGTGVRRLCTCRSCGVVFSTRSNSYRYCTKCMKLVREYQKAIGWTKDQIYYGGEYVNEDEAYINLAGAIVALTLRDYKVALAMSRRFPNDEYYASSLRSLKRALTSDHMDILLLDLSLDVILRDNNISFYGP